MNDENTIDLTVDFVKKFIASGKRVKVSCRITPEVANYIIATYNTGNRQKKPAMISDYSKDMKAGLWAFNGETIKFSLSRLLDGQNRLMACVKARCAFISDVTFGVDDDSFNTIDIGRVRDGADLLAIAGYDDSRNLAHAVRWVHLLLTGTVVNGYAKRLTGKETLHLVQNVYPDLPEFMKFGSKKLAKSSTMRPGVAAGLAYVLYQHNAEKTVEFFSLWEQMEKWGGTVFLHLQKRMMQVNLFALENKTGTPIPKMAAAILAWNLWIEGKKGRGEADVTWIASEPFPEIKGGKINKKAA
jgi:hypothetical protein